MAKKAKSELRHWPADKTERWPIDKIKPYARNSRLHSDAQVAQIAASMQRFGFTAPLLIDEDGELIYGHGRLLAAKQLKLDSVPVAIARDWTVDEKSAYRIADNQIALNSEWDVALLSSEVESLNALNFDLKLLGFDDVELQQLSANLQASATTEATAAQLQGLKFAVIVECDSEDDQTVTLEKLSEMGLSCRALIS